jgi:UDP-GlcNAc:undecaprenyl-phosphate/decaprenyl-phosphate GlcNAc-1-phosphate transferase
MLKYSLLALTAAVLSLALTPLVRRLALRLGAVDQPGTRRVHSSPVPRMGGLAVLGAFLGTLAAARFFDLLLTGVVVHHSWRWLFAGALIVSLVGAFDDVRGLGPVTKLFFQILAGVMVVMGGYGIGKVTNPFGAGVVDLGWLDVPFTLLWVVGVTNAFNLLDGLDGLAAGVALIVSTTLFVLSLAGNRVELALLSVTLAGALVGFLRYNFNPASIFLGDSGSLLLGYLLSVLSIQASQKGATTVVILVPLLALGLPIMDTLLAMLRRLLGALRVVRVDSERNEYQFLVVGSGSIFQADREHIHHRLLKLGLTHRNAVMVLYGVCAVLGALALLAVRSHGADIFLLVTVVAITLYAGVRQLGYQEVSVLQRGTLLPLFDLPVLNRRAVHVLADAALLAMAYVGARLIARGGELDAIARAHLLWSLPTVVAVKLGAFLWDGVYQRSYRYTNVTDLMALLRCLVGAEALAVGAVLVLHGMPRTAGALFLIDFYLTLTLILGARLSFKVLELMASHRTEGKKRRVLIYGAGLSGTMLLREIHQNPSLRYKPVGFLDDYAGLHNRWVNGLPVLGGASELTAVLQRGAVQEVVIASRKIAESRVNHVAEICGRLGIPVRRFQMRLEEVGNGTNGKLSQVS